MKNVITNHGVDQHQREDEKACAPKHEGKAGVWSGRAVDSDREGNHIWPERDCERAEGGREDERHHVEGRAVPAINDAMGKYQ